MMDRYLIETPHKAHECLSLFKLLNAQGYLTHFDWGCESGLHNGWAVIEASNEAEARLAVPPLVRSQALVVKVTKFDADTLAQMHRG